MIRRKTSSLFLLPSEEDTADTWQTLTTGDAVLRSPHLSGRWQPIPAKPVGLHLALDGREGSAYQWSFSHHTCATLGGMRRAASRDEPIIQHKTANQQRPAGATLHSFEATLGSYLKQESSALPSKLKIYATGNNRYLRYLPTPS